MSQVKQKPTPTRVALDKAERQLARVQARLVRALKRERLSDVRHEIRSALDLLSRERSGK